MRVANQCDPAWGLCACGHLNAEKHREEPCPKYDTEHCPRPTKWGHDLASGGLTGVGGGGGGGFGGNTQGCCLKAQLSTHHRYKEADLEQREASLSDQSLATRKPDDERQQNQGYAEDCMKGLAEGGDCEL